MNIVFPSAIYLQAKAAMLNNSHLPVLIYRKVFDDKTANKDKQFQHYFTQNDWKGIWKDGLYDYDHFHSSSHEALGVASGTVEVQLGGEGGKTLTLEAGDLIVLPAGTGHKRVRGSENLVIIGAYPAGQENYDICRSRTDTSGAIETAIAAVPLPQSDPLYGASGPLPQQWNEA